MENINQIPNLQPIQPVEPVKNSNVFKYLFIVSIVVLLGVIIGFYFVLNNKITKLSEEKNTEVTTQKTVQSITEQTIKITEDDAKKVLNLLQTYFNVNVKLTPSDDVFYGKWLVKNDLKILLKGFSFKLGKSTNDGVGKYGNFSMEERLNKTSLQPLILSLDNFFESNGFTKDDTNNYDYGNYSTIGYAKNDLKCLVEFDFDNISDIANIFCGITDQEQLKWRKELSSIIGSEIGKGGSPVTNRISNLIGNYASGSRQTSFATGGKWLAVIIDNKWKEVDSTLENFDCKIVEQYQIPKEIYGDCQ